MSFDAVGWATCLNFKGDRCAKLVLIAICERANGPVRGAVQQTAFPGYEDVAELAECSRKSAIEKVKKLVGLGLVTVRARTKPDGSADSNEYTIYKDRAPDWDALEKQAAAGGEAASLPGEALARGGVVKPSDHGSEADGAEVVKLTAGGGEAASPEPVTTNQDLRTSQGTSSTALAEPAAVPPAPLTAKPLPAAQPAQPPAQHPADPPAGKWEGTGTVLVEIPLAQLSDPVFRVRASLALEYAKDFPALDIPAELRAIRRWNEENPRKRKTREGIRRHITTWLTTAQNDPRKRASARAGTPRASGNGGAGGAGGAASAAPKPCALKCGRPAGDSSFAGIGSVCDSCRGNILQHGRQWRPQPSASAAGAGRG